MVTQEEERRSSFDNLNPKNTIDSINVAQRLHRGAVFALGNDFAEQARARFSHSKSDPNIRRDTMHDVLVKKYAVGLIRAGQAVGLDDGNIFAYMSGLIFEKLVNDTGDPIVGLHERLSSFGNEHLEFEEREIAKQLAYLLEMGWLKRKRIVDPLLELHLDQQVQDEGSVERAFNAWEKLGANREE